MLMLVGVSRAGGVREVEHDGRVGGLKADGTGRGVDECRVPVCHNAVTFMNSSEDMELGPDSPLDCV